MSPPAARRDFSDIGPWPVAITIPAQNEAARILCCLDAARVALRRRGGIVLAVNGSQDSTWHEARDWFERTGTPGILLHLPETPAGGVGAVRHLAVMACAGRLTLGAAVMTTDADCTVFPDWVDANLEGLRHADLICGAVVPDPAEYQRLPEVIRRSKSLEGHYMTLTRAARQRLDPVPHDPDPAHLVAPGASLAFRMPLYRDVGGFPALTVREDRVFAEGAEARAWRVRHASAPRVVASCRLDGRAPGGMAGSLKARAHEINPLVDELLEPAPITMLRYRLRGQMRRASPSHESFVAAWAALEHQRLDLRQSPRMRLREVERELPRLEAALADAAAHAGRQTA